MTLGHQSSTPREALETLPAVPERFGQPATASMVTEPVPFVLDLSTVATTLRLRARAIIIGTVIGALAGSALVFLVPPRFSGRAMMLIRTTNLDPMSAVKGRMGPLAELMPGALGGDTDEELSTEIALLSSRATLGAVVDSLQLQVVPRSPRRVPATAIVDSLRLTGRFKPVKVDLVAGANQLPQGTVWARREGSVKIFDREEAIDELDERLNVSRVAGNAVEITYAARDSVSASAVPNLVAATYMARRRTVDRGLNQRRLEFLLAKDDSLRVDLRQSADRLAATAERSGLGAAPEISGRTLAEEASDLETRLAEIRAGELALDSLILSAREGRMDARWLAGFPDLLRSPALNDLLSQIARVETERTVLLARVPETNPQAMAMARARDSLAAQVLPIASSYRRSLAQQRSSLERDLERVRGLLSNLPAQTAAVSKEQAEVLRLTQMNVAMGAQVLEARMAAMLEGGDVRVVDPAVSPRRVTFPRPLPTIAICTVLGLAGGLFYALMGLRRSSVELTNHQ